MSDEKDMILALALLAKAEEKKRNKKRMWIHSINVAL